MGRDSFKRKREPISDYSDSPVEISSEEDIIKPSKPPPPLVKKIVTFAKTMDASSITYSRMYIPLGFLNEAGIRSDMSIELRDRKGRLWPVTLSYNSRKLSSGWKSFVDNNGVKIGNRVLFSFKPGGNGQGSRLPFSSLDKLRWVVKSQNRVFLMIKTKLFFHQKIPWKAAAGLGKKIHLRASNIRGRAWRVAVETMGENLFFAGGGWKAFSRDVHLKLGEYIFFSRTGRSEFEASVYEITGCERDLRIPVSESETSSETGRGSIKREQISDSDSMGDSPIEISGEEDTKRTKPPPVVKKSISFAKTMTFSNIKNRMFLPVKFLNEAGIRGSMSIEVRDGKGRSWPMILNYKSRNLWGWRSFVRNHGVQTGNTVVFSFEPGGNVLEAIIHKKKTVRKGLL
ncbi:hypothetical protein M569_16234 [Genlisea aurea]|uniref:TF-B3 domain-containing protein n=1 Tax=Genlisea aurea TaxID=192259 RepID=S8BVG0_9LAMI|nr:hypothetical protein M569_16234 [Genlisea aurea]